MPKYTKDIDYIVQMDDVDNMLARGGRARDKFIVAVLYITGARPSEIRELKRQDISVTDDEVIITLKTLKLGATEKFIIRDRTLTFSRRETPFIDHVIKYWETAPEKLIPISLRRVEQIIDHLSQNQFCPYHFRHTRLTKLARQGATIDELMYWKGASSHQSVAPYLRAKPIRRKYDID